ncbi:MAG TPA: alpha/beta fold hydrolase [Acidimicrobiales bacterium]|nr:alpha/beta fold hydrolase [Acidimicrobiales bacterium]
MRVVSLPGMSGAGSYWRPVADRLPAQWEHVFLDWPGLGAVPPSAQVRSLDDLVGLVLATLTVPSAVVAQSMGGVIATRAALDAPEAISHLVLTATSGGVDVAALGAVDWRGDYRERWPSAPAWAFEPPADLSGRLATLRLPTLLIWGTRDRISPPAIGEHLVGLLPNSRFALVDTAEHMFAPVHAEEVALEITRHLSAPVGTTF